MILRTALVFSFFITSASFGSDSTAVTAAPVTNDSAAAAAQAAVVSAQDQPVPADLGSLRIASDPAEAIVVLDSVEKGKTPVVIDGLNPGEHQLQLKKKGYYIKKATVLVEAGKTQEISLQLVRPARLAVTSSPAGAQIKLNGVKVGVTPYLNEKQAPGEYPIQIELAGYQSVESTISVKNGGSDSLSYQLEKPAVQPATPVKAQKQKPNLALTLASVGVFLVFSLVVLLVEVTK